MFFFFWRKHLMSSLLNAHAFWFGLMLWIIMDYFCALLFFRSHYKAISWILLFFFFLCGNDFSMLFLHLTCFVGMFCSECCVVFYPMGFMGFTVVLILSQFMYLSLLYVQKIDRKYGKRNLSPSFEQNLCLCKNIVRNHVGTWPSFWKDVLKKKNLCYHLPPGFWSSFSTFLILLPKLLSQL